MPVVSRLKGRSQGESAPHHNPPLAELPSAGAPSLIGAAETAPPPRMRLQRVHDDMG